MSRNMHFLKEIPLLNGPFKVRGNAVLHTLNIIRYFGSPFGCYPTFHTLTSVGRKKAFFKYVKKCCRFFML